MPDPVISEIKYLGGGTLDFLEVRVPDDYPDPENLRLVIYDRTHNGSTTASPSASDIHEVTADGLLYTEDADSDGNDDDGFLHYTFGTSENGTTIFLHAQDAVGLYNVDTGETYGLYNWSGSSYTVSTASGDPFAGQTAELLDNTGQVSGVTSLVRQPDGTYTLASTPSPGSSFICFAKGTRILAATGARPIEAIEAGDQVVTKDQGLQSVRWVGQRTVEGLSAFHRSDRPVTIKAHAFGRDVPSVDTHFSPNHAILTDHWKTSLFFGEDEVLTAAKAFLNSDFAFSSRHSQVTYFHVLLDRHSLVQANGMWAESLFLGTQCMEMLSQPHRLEVLGLFPGLSSELGRYGRRARHQIKAHEFQLLL